MDFELYFCSSRVIKLKPGNQFLADPWIAVVREEFPGHELPLFSSLTELQTFQFVLDLCPHLARLRDVWVLNGLTGRELLVLQGGTQR